MSKKKVKDVPPPLTKEERLRGYLATLGYRPKTPLMQGTFEFSKTYTDPSGKLARATAIIGSDPSGLEPDQLKFFNITIQVHVPPTELGIAKAPTFAQTDLTRILTHFSNPQDPDFTGEDIRECSQCRKNVTSFAVDGERAICDACIDKDGAP